MTIRRDLIELEERGVARRVRGGALALGPHTFAERRQSRSRAKAQIAAKLRPFIPVTGTSTAKSLRSSGDRTGSPADAGSKDSECGMSNSDTPKLRGQTSE
jgi:DeoR family fructose operon transcriptional repressor